MANLSIKIAFKTIAAMHLPSCTSVVDKNTPILTRVWYCEHHNYSDNLLLLTQQFIICIRYEVIKGKLFSSTL